MFPVLHLGPFSIQTAGLILLAGVWIGLTVAERTANRYKIQSDILYNSVGVAFIAGILGARIGYILKHSDIFASDPRSMISLNLGLLDVWSGIAVGLLAIFVYGQRKKINWLNFLDATTPLFAVLCVAFPLAHLANGSGYGIPTELPWAIPLWGQLRHPTQVYEAIAAGIILVFLLYPKRTELFTISGMTFLVFVSMTSGVKIFFDAFRGDNIQLIANMRESQILAWFVLAAALIAIGILSGNIYVHRSIE